MFQARLIQNKEYYIMLLVALAIIFGGLAILQHTPIIKKDVIATGFLLDLLLTIPVCYYFIIIRPRKQKAQNLFIVFSLCTLLAYSMLPAHQRDMIISLKKLTVFLELGFFIYIFTRIPKISAIYRKLQSELPNFPVNFRQSIIQVLGNRAIVRFFSNEVLMLRYGLFFWIRSAAVPNHFKKFDILKESGYSAFFGILLFVGAIEVMAFHLVLNHYNHTAAVITTIISVYGMFLFIGDYAAIVHNPLLLTEEQIVLRTGLRWSSEVELSHIAGVEKVKNLPEVKGDFFVGAVMKSSVNIKVTFTKPISITKLYGKPVSVTVLYLYVENAEEFIATITG